MTQNTTTTSSQASAYQAMIDALAQLHLDQGQQPMSGDDTLLVGAVNGWSIAQALKTRALAVDVEHAMQRLAPDHVWHQINGLDLDLDHTGTLTITSEAGMLRLPAQAALGLLMFFQFPNVATLISQGDAARQRAMELQVQTEQQK